LAPSSPPFLHLFSSRDHHRPGHPPDTVTSKPVRVLHSGIPPNRAQAQAQAPSTDPTSSPRTHPKSHASKSSGKKETEESGRRGRRTTEAVTVDFVHHLHPERPSNQGPRGQRCSQPIRSHIYLHAGTHRFFYPKPNPLVPPVTRPMIGEGRGRSLLNSCILFKKPPTSSSSPRLVEAPSCAVPPRGNYQMI
jgi:hypothetical protein